MVGVCIIVVVFWFWIIYSILRLIFGGSVGIIRRWIIGWCIIVISRSIMLLRWGIVLRRISGMMIRLWVVCMRVVV